MLHQEAGIVISSSFSHTDKGSLNSFTIYMVTHGAIVVRYLFLFQIRSPRTYMYIQDIYVRMMYMCIITTFRSPPCPRYMLSLSLFAMTPEENSNTLCITVKAEGKKKEEKKEKKRKEKKDYNAQMLNPINSTKKPIG